MTRQADGPVPIQRASFPCHPGISVREGGAGGGWLSCPACGSLLRSGGAPAPVYDGRYCADRRHHDDRVGECKVRSLDRWLKRQSLRPDAEVVCEIGFGGASCLATLHRRGAFVLGLEPIAENRENALRLGIPRERIFDTDRLPALPKRPTLWLFQDSFEHVPDPGALLDWMARESSPAGARALVVAPDAASWSRRVLGRFWPHDLPDHWIHYTRAGVRDLFQRAGFRLASTFRPWKCVTLGMMIGHATLIVPALKGRLPGRRIGARVWFNLGEMGLLLERHAR